MLSSEGHAALLEVTTKHVHDYYHPQVDTQYPDHHRFCRASFYC
ncbi:MAG: hypothetical protein RMX65_030430 [Nostoc sp. DedQUE01]